MFEKTPSPPLQVLPISNYWKGGDFMGTELCPDRATAYAISRMEWEGPPLPGEEILPTINPDQGRVVTENPRFPERNGRSRSDSTSKTAVSTDPLLRQPK